MKRVYWILIGIILLVVIVFSAWKIWMNSCIERTQIEIPEYNVPEQELTRVADILENQLLDMETLAEKLNDSRILLVGEVHNRQEVLQYFLDILEHLPDKQLVLNLELPSSIQNNIDTYLESGEEHYLDTMKTTLGCLQYQDIIRWSYHNQKRVVKVLAMDETQARIRFNRNYLCEDTRNETMKKIIYQTYRDFPDAKIIAYAGQMHMLKSGRYKFDIENRMPAGSRLINSNIPSEDIRVVMIAGEGDFPLSSAWKQKIGVLEMGEEFAHLPFLYFYTYPLYRINHAGELFDYFVNVGKTTPIEK